MRKVPKVCKLLKYLYARIHKHLKGRSFDNAKMNESYGKVDAVSISRNSQTPGSKIL